MEATDTNQNKERRANNIHKALQEEENKTKKRTT